MEKIIDVKPVKLIEATKTLEDCLKRSQCAIEKFKIRKMLTIHLMESEGLTFRAAWLRASTIK